MDKDKMIDELAKDICNGCQTRISRKTLGRCVVRGCTMASIVAEYLVNKNYRKIPDSYVILPNEVYCSLTHTICKEMAKEIYVLARQFASQAAFPENMFHKFIKEIEDRYKIGVEE